MQSLCRVNSDSSFVLSFAGGLRVLIDPWLTRTPEVDGHELFNKAEHDDTKPPVGIESIGKIDVIVISMPFSDHCHELTLEQFDSRIPILAVAEARKRLMTHGTLRQRAIGVIPDNTLLNWNDIFQIAHVPSTGLLDFTHNGLLITTKSSDKQCLFYCPHGFRADQITPSCIIKTYNGGCVDLLMTTFTRYRLPLLLGSDVNLGIENALELLSALQVKAVVDVHSGNKTSSGLVPLFARASHPPEAEILEAFQARTTSYVSMDDYEEHPEVFAVGAAAGKRKSADGGSSKKKKKKKVWSQHH